MANLEKMGVQAVIEDLPKFMRGFKQMQGAMAKTSKTAEKTSKDTTKSWKKLAQTAAKVSAVAIAGLAAIGGAMFKLAKDAAPIAGVREAFEGLTKTIEGGSEEILRSLRKASSGMITTTDLMKSFNLATLLIGESFTKKLPDAMKLVGKVALATGEDMGFLMDSLVRGIGRLQPLIIDNLGITVNLIEAYEDWAKQNDRTVKSMTKTEQQAALMAQTMSKLAEKTADMPDVAGSAQQVFVSFETTLKNFKDTMGLAVLPMITKFMTKLGGLADRLTDVDEVAKTQIITFAGVVAAILGVVAVVGTFITILAKLKIALIELGAAETLALGPIGLLIIAAGALTTALIVGNAKVKALREEFIKLEREALETSKTYKELEEAIRDAAEETEQYVFTQEEFNKLHPRAQAMVRNSKRAIVLLGEATFDAAQKAKMLAARSEMMTQKLRDAHSPTEQLEEDMKDLATAEEIAAEKAKELARAQAEINKEFSDLQLLIKTDLSKSYEDMLEDIDQVNESQEDFNERIAETSQQIGKYQRKIQDIKEDIAKYQRKIQEVREDKDLTSEEQIEKIAEYNERIDDANESIRNYKTSISDASGQIGDLREELDKVPARIDEITEAWQKQTKELIFNLAVQRFQVDGLSKEELKVLATLAGPKGLGLVDEAGQAMIEIISEAGDILDLTGDQSEIVSSLIVQVAEDITNVTGEAEDLVATLEELTRIPWQLKIEPHLLLRHAASEQGSTAELSPEELSPEELELFEKLGGDIALSTITPVVSNSNVREGDNLNLTINTSAPVEPIIADFRMMRAMGGRV